MGCSLRWMASEEIISLSISCASTKVISKAKANNSTTLRTTLYPDPHVWSSCATERKMQVGGLMVVQLLPLGIAAFFLTNCELCPLQGASELHITAFYYRSIIQLLCFAITLQYIGHWPCLLSFCDLLPSFIVPGKKYSCDPNSSPPISFPIAPHPKVTSPMAARL